MSAAALSLFAEPMGAALAAAPGGRRHFYRCGDCLSVAATETKLATEWNESLGAVPAAVCDACGGRLEYMGATAGAVVRKVTGYRPPCDARCTHARGPECECPCGGVNHGSGVVVPIYTDSPIPRLGVPKSARARADYYRELCREFEQLFGCTAGAGVDIWREYKRARKLRNGYTARNRAIQQLIQRMKEVTA